MEPGVRTHRRFDMSKCQTVFEAGIEEVPAEASEGSGMRAHYQRSVPTSLREGACGKIIPRPDI